MQYDLIESENDPLVEVEASSNNASHAAFLVLQSLFLRASWMLLIAAFKVVCVEAPPA